MDGTFENDLLPLYNEMKKFDFKKPFSVITQQVDDSNEIYNIAEDICNRNERNDNTTVSVYFQKENTHTIKNKENLNFNRNDTYNVVQSDNYDITRLNKTQECTDLCAQNWISDLLHTKETQCFSTPHNVQNQSTSSVSGELSYRERNSSDLFSVSESISSSKSSSGNCHPISSVSVLSCSKRNLSFCNSNFSPLNNKLNFVSMNLVNTLRAWSYYSAVSKNKSVTVARKIDARKKFEAAKNIYFQSSREIVEQEILPQRNNIDFIKDFINETTRLAAEKNVFCTIKDVESVYNHLLGWVLYMRNHETALNVKQNPQKQMTGNSEFPETSALRQMLQFNGNIPNNMNQSKPSINEGGSKTCLLSYGSPGNELSININTEILNNINRQNSLNNLGENNNVYRTNISSIRNNYLTCETSHHDAVPIRRSPTRSTSRDSGFMSPVTEQNNIEEIIQEPYITHVTSLNPHATYIPPGNCMVCGKISSQKCLGCFNIYYCSNKCQSLHWARHKEYCTNSVR